MKRQYKIGDVITVRGRKYEVRDQRDWFISYCDHCAFAIDRSYCGLRRYYSHFLEDCGSVNAYFTRV